MPSSSRLGARQFAILCVCAFLGGALTARVALAKDATATFNKLDVFGRVLSLIRADYVDEVDEPRLVSGAIDGMVRTLDPHSAYLDPRSYAALRDEIDGEYGGVGLEITSRGDELVVLSPLDGTPAARAGFQPGDRLLAVDGTSLEGLREPEAVRLLLGPPGSSCVVKAMRKGWAAPRELTLIRDVIRIVALEERLFAGSIGYVKIKTFQERTDEELKRRLDKLRKQAGGELKGLVLDLRRDPGGLLDEAVRVADRFLASGAIVTTKGRQGKRVETERAKGPGTEPGYPVVVLVDAGTASASEIVAGALQDHHRAVILGTRTFGKGSVQQMIELDDGSALKLTVARYYTPSGRSIQERGILPDVRVARGPGEQPDEPDVRESDLANHFQGEGQGQAEEGGRSPEVPPLPPRPGDPAADRQLKAALDVLRGWGSFRSRPAAAKGNQG